MIQTSNYNLNKFETTDKLNPTTLNGLNTNADILDTALEAGLTKTLTSPVNVWELTSGLYKLPASCYLIVKHSNNIDVGVTLDTGGILTVTQGLGYNFFYIFGNQGSAQKLFYGKSLLPDGSQGNINISLELDNLGGGHNYSTTEQVVGTWINGKPLYEKTLTGTLGNYASSTLNNNILVDANADFILVKEIFTFSSSGTGTPVSRLAWKADFANEQDIPAGTNYTIRNDGNVRITQNDSSANGHTYYIVAIYTKSTDSAS